MTEQQAVPRTAIAQAAEAALRDYHATGKPVQCPYPDGSPEAGAFRATVQRLQVAAVPGAEGGA